jgi:hypothetical protein
MMMWKQRNRTAPDSSKNWVSEVFLAQARTIEQVSVFVLKEPTLKAVNIPSSSVWYLSFLWFSHNAFWSDLINMGTWYGKKIKKLIFWSWKIVVSLIIFEIVNLLTRCHCIWEIGLVLFHVCVLFVYILLNFRSCLCFGNTNFGNPRKCLITKNRESFTFLL